MSTQRIAIEAPAEAVFSVLIDPRSYPQWLVGARTIGSVDGTWPTPGSAFHHGSGIGPFQVADSTRLISQTAPNHLEVDARARPFGRARARFSLVSPEPDLSELLFEETLTSPILRLFAPIVDPVLRVRNDASLKRLRELILEASRVHQKAAPPAATRATQFLSQLPSE